MKKILIIFGTRPEAIKLASIILALQKETSMTTKICITAQHRSMLDEVLQTFDIKADYDLDIMEKSQDLFSISANVLFKLKKVIKDFEPHLVLVHGDTTTTFIGALSSFYLKIPICHIEAGLRTYDKYSPFPEEINRELTTKLATYHFAPTKLAAKNLLKDGVKKTHISIVGNSVIDTLKLMRQKIKTTKQLETQIIQKINIPFSLKTTKFILVTAHRRESFGKDIKNIAYALKDIALAISDIHIIYPLHLNPNIQKPMREILGEIDNIHLIQPLDYASFVYLMDSCYMILTDSGGIQEEVTFLHKPTLVLRNNTERKEALKCNTLRLVGTNRNKIVKESIKLLKDKKLYDKMSSSNNPLVFGKGNTAKKIIKFIKKI